MIEKLMILYMSGFDLRRINGDSTPYIYSLTAEYPLVKINTVPDADMKTTMWTGRYPHEHGMWQVSLQDERDFGAGKPQDLLPDIVGTTLQCLVHSVTGNFALAGVPDRRRRRFQIHKTKHLWHGWNMPLSFNGLDTIFNIIGEDDCCLLYEERFDRLAEKLNPAFVKGKRLQVYDAHATDLFTHWNIDNDDRMLSAYRELDRQVAVLHGICKEKGITLMLLSDHAQQRVTETLDIMGKIREFGIGDNEISYFVEASKTRFWFHSAGAREKVLEYLSGLGKGTLLHFEELYKYNVKFDDDRYGEYYYITDPGVIFHPNDFYHPLGNIYLALKNRAQRPRLKSPVYRGYHGHLPHNECEKGFMILLDSEYKSRREEVEIIDVVPTVLELLGHEKPPSLEGVAAYEV